ncbi:MAG: tRNA (adenosine(37)-N6)-threonylcarbamoyltransferase complex dimerization subunit type 1 TsaB [Deltaproteobacteria bacterium]|jgi:tRNA threonylcarbamoyl adenosine modification protein YeaZ|nr:tRNA (adenosine(37)-N6)-threonylcarbamoyltransferase complex dimerization subunit type 1 TsaB [Deltaproteobacteria bacterium]
MLVMAWDTATACLDLALIKFEPDSRKILGRVAGDGQISHSQALAPRVKEMLADNSIKPGDLDLLAVGCGPGSFTGLRVGLALAEGLSLGADVPALGLSSLAVLAALAPEGLSLPVIDARHREIFTALYRVGPKKETDRLTGLLALGQSKLWTVLSEMDLGGRNVTVSGPGLSLLKDIPPEVAIGDPKGPSAVVLAEMAYLAYKEGQVHNYPIIPLYGRSPEIFKTWLPPRRLAEVTGNS